MPKVVTISREYGAGGSTIGKAVAERLGIEYLDKAIILTTAYEAGVNVEDVYKLTENSKSSSIFDFYNKPLNDKLFKSQSEVIKLFGERGDCLIVGRNANSILREYDDTLHVFIHASLDFRLNHMMKKEMYKGISVDKMNDLINTVDKRRKKYCEHYTNTEFGGAKNYDICLDSSRIGFDKCVDIICELAK